MDTITLTVFHNGDDSVGIPCEFFDIPFPIGLNVDKLDDDDRELLEDFRTQMINVYTEYCEFKMMAMYCFEWKALAEQEKTL